MKIPTPWLPLARFLIPATVTTVRRVAEHLSAQQKDVLRELDSRLREWTRNHLRRGESAKQALREQHRALEAKHREIQSRAQRADRLSADYLVALGARLVREVGDLARRAVAGNKRLSTLGVDAEIRFRSSAERAAFAAELTAAITQLVSRYHDESAPGGRSHRLVVCAYPAPEPSNS